MVAGVSQQSSRVMQSPWIAPRWGRICGWEHLGDFSTGNALMALQALTTQPAAEILQRDLKLSNLGGIASLQLLGVFSCIVLGVFLQTFWVLCGELGGHSWLHHP